MKNWIAIAVLGLSLFGPSAIMAETLAFNYAKGAEYSYKYTRQDSSTAVAPVISPKKDSDNQTYDIKIKTVDIQNDAFILDIKSGKTTIRRYVAPNGAIKGTPTEDFSEIPFLPVLPTDDWRIGSSVTQKSTATAFGKQIPINWTLTLEKIDKDRGLAEISFSTQYSLDSDRQYSRNMIQKGKIVFDMIEGVIHKADWSSLYKANMVNKELAITRNLWSFEKQTNHSLSMTGVEK